MHFAASNLIAAFSVLALAKAQSLSDALGGNDDLSILASLLQKLDLASALNGTDGYTILAPVNAAFGSLNPDDATADTVVGGVPLSDLLQYHVIDGVQLRAADIVNGTGNITRTLLTASDYVNLAGTPQVVNPVRNGTVLHIYAGAKNASTIVTPDIEFDNGIIHTIDHLLVIPANVTGTAKQNSTLSLSNFAAALPEADGNLVNMLDTMANLTIFAPAAAAYKLANINPPEVDPTRLEDILTYHVVSAGQVLYASDLHAMPNNTNLTTSEGGELKIHFNGSQILVNNATVTTSNLLIKNGVVHIINQLLNPENPKGFVGGFKPSAASSVATPTFIVGLTIAVAAFLL